MSQQKINAEEVKKIFKLSRLSPSEDKIQNFTHEFNSILNFFETLKSVDTSTAKEIAHIHSLRNVLRVDESETPLTQEQTQQNAPQVQHEFFKVPMVVEE